MRRLRPNGILTMTLLAASLLTLSLLPAAALKAPAIPTPGPATSGGQAPAPAAPQVPAARRAQYELFAQKCGRCHGPEKALGAGFTAGEWDTYLRRKYRRAGAGISADQSVQIGSFLRYWSTRAAGAR